MPNDRALMASHSPETCVTASNKDAALTTVNSAPSMSKRNGTGCSLGSNCKRIGRMTKTKQVIANNPFQPQYSLIRPPTMGPKPNAMALPADIIAIADPRRSIGI
ncbi:hypothetical protein D3C85_1478890 [compost metagenome]